MCLWVFQFVSWCVRELLVFREFISRWFGLFCTSCLRMVFVLCWHHRENKRLLMYRNIKSQDDFILWFFLRYCKSTIFQANHNAWTALPFGASSCLRYWKSAIFQASHKWLSLPTYGEWWRAWPSPLAVGRGRCVGYLFGAYYLFLLKCLVSWFYFVSLH